MLELGGNVIGFSEASSSSASKGESMADTAKVISCYADIVAIRHPKEGAPYVASRAASIPVINAGDGGHCHPTQTLTDLCTISREKGRLNDLTVGFCGDLKYGRTVHSLIAALSRYTGIKIVLISPEELQLPSYIMSDVIGKNKMEYMVTGSLEEVIPDLDILYMTRVQGERFADQAEYLRLRDRYILTPDKLRYAKKDLAILHPLPRVNEISVKIDDDPRACYFKQVQNGKYMRMALILKLLEEAKRDPSKEEKVYTEEGGYLIDQVRCHNARCISSTEQELKQIFRVTDAQKRECRCIYCEKKVNF
jgi:aspartate carbamoyltransferase catalytic subunit